MPIASGGKISGTGATFWFQNTRLPYWSMLESGDFEMMKPLFDMYMKALPIRQFATKKYYNHTGAYYPETLNFWGSYTNENYGLNREGIPISPEHRKQWENLLASVPEIPTRLINGERVIAPAPLMSCH